MGRLTQPTSPAASAHRAHARDLHCLVTPTETGSMPTASRALAAHLCVVLGAKVWALGGWRATLGSGPKPEPQPAAWRL